MAIENHADNGDQNPHDVLHIPNRKIGWWIKDEALDGKRYGAETSTNEWGRFDEGGGAMTAGGSVYHHHITHFARRSGQR